MRNKPLRSKSPLRTKRGLKQGKWRRGSKRGKSALVARADRALQEAVLALNPICQYPGCKNKATEGHHIVHRRNFVLRWALKNVPALCHNHHAWDSHPTLKGKLLTGLIQWLGGQAAYDELRLYANTGPSEEPEDAINRLQGLDFSK